MLFCLDLLLFNTDGECILRSLAILLNVYDL